ncbi:MAG: molybdopterin molybdotransferase MoeA [Oscillospiraceae bacterium]|nr:molybdopterin molybdotransferase MoeA [Oscillospiraceae bacterium]
MEQNITFERARELLLEVVWPVDWEEVSLSLCGGRVLAQDLAAREDVPLFDRSPYDGFALRGEDTQLASPEDPVTLRILEEVPAGSVPTRAVEPGTAVKVFTGSPIPHGANGVVMFEDTCFDGDHVTIRHPVKPGSNILRAGEDIRQGDLLAGRGEVIDPGLAGTLAAQGISVPPVFRRPRVALISTGSELAEAEEIPGPGKIRNSNRYMLEAALTALGCEPVYLGIAGDRVDEIACRIREGLDRCDALVTTGGVSVGDYDVTPEAMTAAGAELLFRGVEMKPGMACAYGVRAGKLLCALSGNPASALTNFYAVAMPALRLLAGHRRPIPREIPLTLLKGFGKKSRNTRFLRGQLVLEGGKASMTLSSEQGNVVISSAIGCNVMAMIPAGSGPVPAGTVLKGFLL